MGIIGNFGKTITFEVNSNKIVTPKDIKRSVSARWQAHNILGKKPKSEFLGPDIDETSLTVVLSAEHGIRPRATLDRMESAVASGTVDYLVIGGKIVGKNKVYLESMSEEWNCVWNQGELVKATVELVFKEYT